MSSRKKVSFGSSSGSIVETWIIDGGRSNEVSPDPKAKAFGSSEVCDDVMPTSRDIVVVSQPINCNNNNHVVLNDPITIFRKEMDTASNQANELNSALEENQEYVITTQPNERAVLNVATKTVNFSPPSETINSVVKPNEISSTNLTNVNGNISSHQEQNSGKRKQNNNNNSSNKNNNKSPSAIISTTQQYHSRKRGSTCSNVSGGSQSFRSFVDTLGVDTDTREEYYNVLNPQPVGQTSPSFGYDTSDENHHHSVYHVNDHHGHCGSGGSGHCEGNDDENDDDDDKYYWESDPMLPLREEDPTLLYRVDTVTGWPLKRSDSLESRDNPFLPGGDLCKEAEDLLSKATIIRDNFYLKEEEKRELEQHRQAELQESEQQQQQQQQKSRGATKHVQILDHHDGRIYSSAPDPSSPPHNGGVEERISPQSVSNSFAAPSPTVPSADPNHKGENGKSNDHTSNNASSPESVKIAIPEGEGQSIGVLGQGETLGPDKKRRNKCCSVM